MRKTKGIWQTIVVFRGFWNDSVTRYKKFYLIIIYFKVVKLYIYIYIEKQKEGRSFLYVIIYLVPS